MLAGLIQVVAVESGGYFMWVLEITVWRTKLLITEI